MVTLRQKTPAEEQGSTNYIVRKTGAGTIVDFSPATDRIHAGVDQVLQGKNLTPQRVQSAVREAPQRAIEATLRWHSRELEVKLPAGVAVDDISAALSQVTTVFEIAQDSYQGRAVTRIDVGLKDKVGNEPVSIITDRLYLVLPPPPTKPAPLPATKTGKMAIIIDDFGYSLEPIAAFTRLGRPITFSVLPNRPYTNLAATEALKAGLQVMVHLPMEPLNATQQQEPQVITTNLSDSEIRRLTREAIAQVPGAIGLNNHQGSRATSDERVMRNVLAVVKAHNMFFVDSRTFNTSVAYAMARQAGVKSGENDLFIDNSNKEEDIIKQLLAAAEIARETGQITVIGHARLTTAAAIKKAIPQLEAAGIKLVFVSDLLR